MYRLLLNGCLTATQMSLQTDDFYLVGIGCFCFTLAPDVDERSDMRVRVVVFCTCECVCSNMCEPNVHVACRMYGNWRLATRTHKRMDGWMDEMDWGLSIGRQNSLCAGPRSNNMRSYINNIYINTTY